MVSMRSMLLTVLLWAISVLSVGAQAPVTGLQAVHRSGQTFLTWFERTDLTGEQYRIYRHTQAITAGNLASAQLLNATYPLFEGSSIYHTERERAFSQEPGANGGYVSLRNYIIEPFGAQLSDATGLFVWTTAANGSFYYAITTVFEDQENRADFGTGNTFGPVIESVTDPLPIPVWESASGRGRVYTQFMDFANWNPTYEIDNVLTYAYNYFAGLPGLSNCDPVPPAPYPLLLLMHGHSGRYQAADSAIDACAVTIFVDDPRNSFYLGYSGTYNYWQTQSMEVSSGPIVNYTEQRVLRAVFDVLRDARYQIDPQRVYASGHSMGGNGALALGLRYPQLFAAVFACQPPTDFRAEDFFAFLGDFQNLWGTRENNFPVEIRGRYAGPLTQFNGTGVYDWMCHQQQLATRRGDEMALIGITHGTLDNIVSWPSQGRPVYEKFYLGLRAFSGETAETDHTCTFGQGLGPTFAFRTEEPYGLFYGFRVIRDETVPGLTHASGSASVPPAGVAAYNMNLEWAASWDAWDDPPVDTATRWELSLRSLQGSQTVDVTPRRCQHFNVSPGTIYQWENHQVADHQLIANGTVTGTTDSLLILEGFAVTAAGNRLVIYVGTPSTPLPTAAATNTPNTTPSVSVPTNTETPVITPTEMDNTHTPTAATPLASPTPPPTSLPGAIQAFHRSGQTFLTWAERTDLTGEEYRVYRDTAPLSAGNLTPARRIAQLPEGTSIYYTERMRAEDPVYAPETNGGYASLRNYIINPLGPQLSDNTGLFVWTTGETQSSYYAVTTVVGEQEVFLGATGALQETLADPEPVLVWESPSGYGRVYTQFMDFAHWNTTFENTPGPTYAYNYFVGMPNLEVCNEVIPASYAAIIHIEGYGTRYEAAAASHYFCALEIWCDDGLRTWYYGYSATHDYRQTEAPVTTGPIVNFTEQRIQRALYDTLRDARYHSADAGRVYAYGESMGGSGSLSLGLRYPNVFAAVYCGQPMTNYYTADTWYENDLLPRWGSRELNLPIENRGVYAAHLARYNGTGVWNWMNHHRQLLERRGDECALIGLDHGNQDDTIVWETQGRPAYQYFHLGRRAFSASIIASGHAWAGFIGAGPDMGEINGPFFGMSVIKNETIPGLTYASGSLPPVPDNTAVGGYNLNLEWSASWNAWAGPPVDTPTRWEIAVRSLEGAQTVDITPRRCQQFVITPGTQYLWTNLALATGDTVANGLVTCTTDGIIIVSAVQVTQEGNRLILERVGGITPSPTRTGSPEASSTGTPTMAITLTPTPICQPNYDLDGDGVVAAEDLLQLMTALREGAPLDLSCDGQADYRDVWLLAMRWRHTFDVTPSPLGDTPTALPPLFTATAIDTPTPLLTQPSPEISPTTQPQQTATITLPAHTATAMPTGSPVFSVPLEVRLPEDATGAAPITVGVPLERSELRPEDLTVVGPEGPVPSQIRGQSRIGQAGPWMWLLVDFQASPGATYRLEQGVPPAPASALQINTLEGGGYTINTGAGAWQILPNKDILGSVLAGDGAPLLAGAVWDSTPATATVELVESGPLRAMFRISAQAAVQGLDLVARIHFFAGLPYARVQLTLRNAQICAWGYEEPQADNTPCEVEAGQPVCNTLASPRRKGLEDVTWSLRLTAPATTEQLLYQDSSGTEYWNYYVGQGPRMQSGVTRKGYRYTSAGVEIDSGTSALGTMQSGRVRVEVPFFREIFPKALRLRGDRLEVGLFPGEFSQPHVLRAMEQKTYEVWISLNPDVRPPWEAYAFPGYAWMRQTHALGYLGPRVRGGQAEAYEAYLDAQFDDSTDVNPDDCNNDLGICATSLTNAQERFDFFGYTDFGDIPLDYEDPRGPMNLKYDVNLGFIQQALRTNIPVWWHWARIGNWHFADTDILHTSLPGYSTARAWFEGGAFGHSLHNEPGLANPHRNCNNITTDLTYGLSGLAAWALLTGDDMVREAALELADNMLWRIRNTGDTPCEQAAWGCQENCGGFAALAPRSGGNIARMLGWAFRLTGDTNYLDGPTGVARWCQCASNTIECYSWPTALLGRGIGEYLLLTRDWGLTPEPAALPVMQSLLAGLAAGTTRESDRLWFSGCTGNEINSWMLLAADVFALGYAATGDRTWLDQYAWPAFNTGQLDPYYEGDQSEYHSTKELVNVTACGTAYLHFAAGESIP